MTAALALKQGAAGDGRSTLSVRPLQVWNFHPCPLTQSHDNSCGSLRYAMLPRRHGEDLEILSCDVLQQEVCLEKKK